MKKYHFALLAAAVVAVSGCTYHPVLWPHPFQAQTALNNVRHWQGHADEVISCLLDTPYDRIYLEEKFATEFDTAFSNALRAAASKAKILVTNNPKNAVEISWTTQVVSHRFSNEVFISTRMKYEHQQIDQYSRAYYVDDFEAKKYLVKPEPREIKYRKIVAE